MTVLLVSRGGSAPARRREFIRLRTDGVRLLHGSATGGVAVINSEVTLPNVSIGAPWHGGTGVAWYCTELFRRGLRICVAVLCP